MMRKIIKFIVRKVPRVWLIRFSYAFSKIIMPFYSGNNVYCPVCEKKFRKFLPYGNKGADNRLCPSCLSLERHRLIWLYLKNETDFFSSTKKVLHIAPEQAFRVRFKKLPNIDYTTADLESPIADVKLDVTNMPLKDETYDVVMCNHVMEHITNEAAAVSEIYRVLKKGGYAIMQVPLDASISQTIEDKTITDPHQRELLYGQYDHVRLYGTDYPERMKKHAPFEVVVIDYIAKLPTSEIERLRLDKSEKLFIFKKK